MPKLWFAALAVPVILAAGCSPRRAADDPPARPPASSVSAAAQTPVPDSCDSAATQMAMNTCYGGKAKVADSLETATVAAVRAGLHSKGEDDRIPELEAAEKAWTAYRDAQCKAEAGLNEGGSIVPLVYATCRGGLATRRTEELKEVYQELLKQ